MSICLIYLLFFHTSKLCIASENLGYYTTQFQFFPLSNDVIRVILWFIRVRISRTGVTLDILRKSINKCIILQLNCIRWYMESVEVLVYYILYNIIMYQGKLSCLSVMVRPWSEFVFLDKYVVSIMRWYAYRDAYACKM